MFHVGMLKNRFKLRVSDFNKICEFLNNLCGGLGIRIKRPDNPSASNPPVVEIDRKDIADLVAEQLVPVEPENPQELASGEKKNDSGVWAASGDSWTAGDKGATVWLPCRSGSDGVNGIVRWRKFVIAPDGRIYAIRPEDGNSTEYYANPPA